MKKRPQLLDRVQPAAHRDADPARLRRGDGLLGQLDQPILSDGGLADSTFYLKKTLIVVGIGLVADVAGDAGRT